MYSQPPSDTGVTTTGKRIATRQRVSRACDRCNHLRVKCDGQRPCEHCLVYGLDCKYNRERKKRGKGSTNSKEKRAASSEASCGSNKTPMTPVTARTSPASSPGGTFHLSIPPSHLFNGGIVEKSISPETTPENLVLRNSSEPLQSYPPHISCKTEPWSPTSSLSPAFSDPDECYRDSQPLNPPRSGYQIPEPGCYASQVWSRSYDNYDHPKVLPSSGTPPGNYQPMNTCPPVGYQTLTHMPLCGNCHSSPSTRLYPGSIVWVPFAPSAPPPPGYGAFLGGEETLGAYYFMEQFRPAEKNS